MSEFSTLLAEYLDAMNAGELPELEPFLARTDSAEDRAELARQIEAAIAIAPESQRHPVGEDGSPVLGLPTDQIDRLVAESAEIWPLVLPTWRADRGLSVAELAGEVLDAASIESDQSNVRAAGEWIVAMEAGVANARMVSVQALEAIAGILGVGFERFVGAGGFEPEPSTALRSWVTGEDEEADAEDLGRLVELLSESVPGADGVGDVVDEWFVG